MLAMYSDLAYSNWADMLLFVQLAHNTAYSSTLHETPRFFMFGRPAVLPIDLILGVPATSTPQSPLDYMHETVDKLHLAYELARLKLKERSDKQACANDKLSFPKFVEGYQVLIHYPHTNSDGPNPKLLSPWRGPFTVRSQLSPVVYRVSKDGEIAEFSVHLGRMKKYRSPSSSSHVDHDVLDELFLGTKLPTPDLSGDNSVKFGPFTIEGIDGHKRGVGAASQTNFQYHLKLKDYPTSCGVWRHVRVLPQCTDMIASYRAEVLSRDPTAFDPPQRKSNSVAS